MPTPKNRPEPRSGDTPTPQSSTGKQLDPASLKFVRIAGESAEVLPGATPARLALGGPSSSGTDSEDQTYVAISVSDMKRLIAESALSAMSSNLQPDDTMRRNQAPNLATPERTATAEQPSVGLSPARDVTPRLAQPLRSAIPDNLGRLIPNQPLEFAVRDVVTPPAPGLSNVPSALTDLPPLQRLEAIQGIKKALTGLEQHSVNELRAKGVPWQ